MKATASLRDRAVGYFVAPRPPTVAVVAPRTAAPPPRSAPRVAVLGSATDAAPVAGALACGLRAGMHAPAAVVAIWAAEADVAELAPPGGAQGRPALAVATEPADGPAPPRPAPASPAASRLAGRLAGRGLAAVARGRLAWVRLAGHPVAAALAARRLAGAIEVPLVLALAGPRAEVLEAVLREQDLVVVVAADPEGALARLALAGCQGPSVACAPLPAGPTRLLALAGLSGVRALDPRLRAALERLARPTGLPELVDPAGADW